MGSLSGMVAFSFPSPPLLPFLCRWVNQSAGGMVLGMVMVMVAGCGVEGKSPTVLASVSSSPVASSQASSPLTVVTTIVPLTQFTQAVAGTRARVVQLLPTDTAPHDFQAKPKDLETLAGARVLVENGLGLEAFLGDLIQNARNPQLAVVDTSQGVPRLAQHPSGTGGAVNPHIWLDPQRAQIQVRNIRDGLIAADPEGKPLYTANAAAYIQQLQTLDQSFARRLAPYRGHTFITFHDFAQYFAQRYGLNAAFLVDIPEDSPTPQDIQRTMTLVQTLKIKALLTEPAAGKGGMAALAADLRVSLSEFDPMETGSTDPQAYFQVMNQNLNNIEKALGVKEVP